MVLIYYIFKHYEKPITSIANKNIHVLRLNIFVLLIKQVTSIQDNHPDNIRRTGLKICGRIQLLYLGSIMDTDGGTEADANRQNSCCLLTNVLSVDHVCHKHSNQDQII